MEWVWGTCMKGHRAAHQKRDNASARTWSEDRESEAQGSCVVLASLLLVPTPNPGHLSPVLTPRATVATATLPESWLGGLVGTGYPELQRKLIPEDEEERGTGWKPSRQTHKQTLPKA